MASTIGEGNLQLDDLVVKQLIGRGKYGEVFLCRTAKCKKTPNKSGTSGSDRTYYAMKKIDRKEAAKCKTRIQHILAEKECLRACGSCVYIIDLVQTLKDEYHLYFVLELVEGNPLYVYLRNNRALDIIQNNFAIQRQIGYEIMCAMQFIHNKGYVYRDLKASNVMLGKDGHVKLLDFGFSKKIDDGRTTTFCGTLHAMAPEVLALETIEYGYEVDHWSFGVILFEILTGTPPCVSESREKVFEVAHSGYQETLRKQFRLIVDNHREKCVRNGGVDSSIAATDDYKQDVTLLENLLSSIWQTSPQNRCGSSRGFKDIENHEYFCDYANKMTTLGQNRASHPLVLHMIAESRCKILNFIEEDVDGDAIDQTLFKGF